MAQPLTLRLAILRPPPTPTFRLTSPPVRHAATAFMRKRQRENLPLAKLPKKTRKPAERQKQFAEKLERPQPRLPRPHPLPLAVPTVQETTPTEEYFVRRTPSRQLPVYQDSKSGGNLRITRVRKIEGKNHVLRDQLEEHLTPKPEWIRINPVTQHVEMKGWYKAQIDLWLEAKGF